MNETELAVMAARWRERVEIERLLRGLRLGRLVGVAPLGRFSDRLEVTGSWADLQKKSPASVSGPG